MWRLGLHAKRLGWVRTGGSSGRERGVVQFGERSRADRGHTQRCHARRLQPHLLSHAHRKRCRGRAAHLLSRSSTAAAAAGRHRDRLKTRRQHVQRARDERWWIPGRWTARPLQRRRWRRMRRRRLQAPRRICRRRSLGGVRLVHVHSSPPTVFRLLPPILLCLGCLSEEDRRAWTRKHRYADSQ